MGTCSKAEWLPLGFSKHNKEGILEIYFYFHIMLEKQRKDFEEENLVLLLSMVVF